MWDFPPSLIYDIAQQMSVKISSISFSISTFVRLGMHLFTFSKSGAGLPLQKFESVQLAFRTKLLPAGILSSKFAIGNTAPD
jgi:hypothetical protein